MSKLNDSSSDYYHTYDMINGIQFNNRDGIIIYRSLTEYPSIPQTGLA